MLESIAALFCDPVYDFTHALKCIKFTLSVKNVKHFKNIKKILAQFKTFCAISSAAEKKTSDVDNFNFMNIWSLKIKLR